MNRWTKNDGVARRRFWDIKKNLGRGGLKTPPSTRRGLRPSSGFSFAMAKRRKIFSSYFVTLSSYSLRIFQQKKKIAGSGQFRSPERVCWPHLRKVCNHVRARVFQGAISSLQVFIIVPVCIICLSQNGYICDLRSGHSSDHYSTSLWENNETCSALSKRVKTTQFFQDYVRLSYL